MLLGLLEPGLEITGPSEEHLEPPVKLMWMVQDKEMTPEHPLTNGIQDRGPQNQ